MSLGSPVCPNCNHGLLVVTGKHIICLGCKYHHAVIWVNHLPYNKSEYKIGNRTE